MGLETISYRRPQLWNLVLTEIKDAQKIYQHSKRKYSHGTMTIIHVGNAKYTMSM